MLNCCIERKLARENLQQLRYDTADERNDSSDDDEFSIAQKNRTRFKKPEKKQKFSLWNQPTGRQSKFNNLKLLKTGDPLYVPITQEPVIKTEDQLEEDADILLKLGSDAEASELRARIMSASLLSDMESFKAANPGSVVEDFIRWYSPRDWIEEEEVDEWEQKKGHLSPRMLIEENNIWVQMWKTAKPVPAKRQKRLFDDTREAEKVLQFLDLRTISQICELIIPILSHAAIYRLIEESQLVSAELSEAKVRINSILKHGERISRDVQFQPRRFEALIQEVTTLELLISQINSLQYKLNPSGSSNNTISDLVGNLVMGKEVEIENTSNSNVGSRIVSMFSDVQKVVNVQGDQQGDTGRNPLINTVFPPANEREFVMRVSAVKPASYSAKCPHF
ncbi:hypothetical protein NQ317_007681 [Molorchus minor]|uniref:Rab3 GTPase-activating protein catalytic subunit n=1 Tax=Molorchus minor TaxID=1323400 RepID=A0ABQ9JNC5_9CUCU|nr:hypothetical protein NQ317_007681 [Molorchus minor]